MLFSSISFLFLYLPFVLLGNAMLRSKARLVFLFILSLVFYGWGEPGTVVLMLASILVSYVSALDIQRQPQRKKAVLIASVSIQLIFLAYFKYATMFFPTVKIALPVGISFYTFQAIAYVIDAYRGNIPPDRDLIRYGTFITFFPQLIAGPIERYHDIRPQLENPAVKWTNFADGTRLFVIGLSKKLLLANAAGQVWDALKDTPLLNGYMGNWVGLIAFAFQIYFDFSGYSDMARGLGLMMGIKMRPNFNYPYSANSITDFWRRWHMTLSSWFRDYVYIPLGGNRKGLIRQIVNILIVWGLTGLWHGASINFVLWGLYFSVLLILEKLFLLRLYGHLKRSLQWLPRLVTIVLVLISWCIFSLTDLSDIQRYLFGLFSGTAFSAYSMGHTFAFAPLFIVCALASVPIKIRLPGLVEDLALCALLLLCIGALVSQGYNPFLYFRF